MYRIYIHSIIAAAIIFLFPLCVLCAEPWKVEKDKDGIRVETRPIEGLSLKEFRSRCVVDAPIEVVFEIIKDNDSYMNWFADCVERAVIQKNDDHTNICYMVADLPFPFRDRDTVEVIKYILDWMNGKVVVKINSIDPPDDAKYGMDEHSKKKKRIRMKKMKGTITLTRVTPVETEMVYQAHGDPVVELPGWLMNFFVVSQPYRTLQGMQKEIQKKIYYEKAEKVHHKKFVRQTR